MRVLFFSDCQKLVKNIRLGAKACPVTTLRAGFVDGGLSIAKGRKSSL